MKVSSEIEDLIPYIPGKPISETQREYGLESVLKLASNEAPYGPSPKVVEVIISSLHHLNRYPDAGAYEMGEFFANHYDVSKDSLVFGNGSNELIDLLIRVFCEPGQFILTSESAFIAYKICAQAARVRVLETPMVNMGFDLSAMKEKVEQYPVRIVFIANPNNPTGTYLNKMELSGFLNFMDDYPETLVVLDEAYTEFVRAEDYPCSLELFRQHSNVVVLRTLSKVYGLAGLRLGFLVGDSVIANYLHRVRNPFNVNYLAQVAGRAAISDRDYVNQLCQMLWKELDGFYKKFEQIGIKYFKSQGNFVLIDLEREASPIYKALLQRGVITRPVKGYGLKNHLRLTVGLPRENKVAMEHLADIWRGL